jgi:hypothetical protein
VENRPTGYAPFEDQAEETPPVDSASRVAGVGGSRWCLIRVVLFMELHFVFHYDASVRVEYDRQ